MKLKEMKPYLITGIVTAVIAFFAVPWLDTLRWPGTTYTEGFNILNTIIAIGAGFALAFTLYRSDRNKAKQPTDQETDQDTDQDTEL